MTRLIDVDYLLKELEDWQADLDDAIPGRKLGVTDAMAIACQIPTVNAVPVSHGRWIYRDDDFDFYDTYTCSECDGQITVDAERHYDMGMLIEDVLYCPHCGSRNVVETWNVPDWRKKDDER